jgi:hypothetical protein
VNEGKLKVSLKGEAEEAVQPVIVTIIQTEKPALVPTITLIPGASYKEGPEGELNLLEVQTKARATSFTATLFEISPIDFDESDIRIVANEGSTYIFAPDDEKGYAAWHAGDLDETVGTEDQTGDYIVAYHRSITPEQALAKPTTATDVAKLYIDVIYVAPTEIVGIELNTDVIGKATTASFWSNTSGQRKAAGGFILVRLNNDTSREWASSSDSGRFPLLAGNFDSYLEGRQTEDVDHGGWFPSVGLKQNDPVPSVGTPLKFDVTVKEHFGEEDWTVTVETKTVAP